MSTVIVRHDASVFTIWYTPNGRILYIDRSQITSLEYIVKVFLLIIKVLGWVTNTFRGFDDEFTLYNDIIQ